jgi:hypothetical protein
VPEADYWPVSPLRTAEVLLPVKPVKIAHIKKFILGISLSPFYALLGIATSSGRQQLKKIFRAR